ncbi:MAG: hypothetical protein ACFFG0_02135 [Candidatus Thorarchaeota archaeon]
MASKIDLFWEIFQAISSGTGDITDVLDAIAKADRTKLESYFGSVIDQVSFGTPDYNRLRKFLIDLYASHRTLTTASTQVSDPHSLPNSDLDELFRSFGYPYSSSLHSIDENPLEQKVQFFLDLVNLYKVKGTPQSLVDVLQYYGVTEVDIYEFFLKLQDQNNLYFEGKAVAGTTVGPGTLSFPYENLTANDPHWLYTENQILQLNNNLSINLPSKTPYIGVQPIVQIDGPEASIISRRVQDQYDYYNSTGTLPTANAEISYIGEIRTLLELYLSSLYMFNNLFDVGADATSFICYDGTNTTTSSIITEYNLVTAIPTSRASQKSQLAQYYDLFTRAKERNFLQVKSDPGAYLNSIAPDIKASLDSAGEPLEVLYSLLNDISIWARNNIGLGFINFGFILFGVQLFFTELKPVIEFFKPYRARLLLLESLQIRNRLLNSIVVEDQFTFDANLQFIDYVTGDSVTCCGDDVIYDSTSSTACEGSDHTECSREVIDPTPILVWKGLWTESHMYSVGDAVPDYENNYYVCKVAHSSTDGTKPGLGVSWTTYWTKVSQITCTDSTRGATYYSRETFDCGSYFDYGAVVDDEVFIEFRDVFTENLKCPIDGTDFVVSELSNDSTPEYFLSTSIDSTESFIYDFWQQSGFRNFDEDGSFDCQYAFDAVHITAEQVGVVERGFLTTEADGKLLQENGGRLIIDTS